MTIGPLVAVVREQAQRYPVAANRVAGALTVACFVATAEPLERVGAAVAVAAAGVLELRHRLNLRKPQAPELPAIDPEAWFEDVCARAKVPVPLIKSHWPTEKGHAYHLLITEWIEREGRPMTVDSWLAFCPLLRDVAGVGCRFVNPRPDPNNGGVSEIEFEGIRLAEWRAPMACTIAKCRRPAKAHVLINDGEQWGRLCADHLAAHDDQVTHGHDITDDCTGHECWAELWDDEPDQDEAVRECTPHLEPLSPQVILPGVSQEGSSGWPAPDPATRRPPGADPGTKGGVLFDYLLAQNCYLRRGVLAAHAELSPTTVDRMLTAWADIGVVEKFGQLWQVSSRYHQSVSITRNGREEEPGE